MNHVRRFDECARAVGHHVGEVVTVLDLEGLHVTSMLNARTVHFVSTLASTGQNYYPGAHSNRVVGAHSNRVVECQWRRPRGGVPVAACMRAGVWSPPLFA